MTSTPVLPSWVVPGASVVQVNHERAVQATVVRVTPTGLVRLNDNATYKLASHGRTLVKTGEPGPWFGRSRPTELVPAAEYFRQQSSRIVQAAIRQIGQLDSFACEPSDVLAQMQAAVDATRTKLAEIAQKAANAGCPAEMAV